MNIDSPTTGSADIICPAGSTITLTNTKCVVHIGSQGNLKTITYSNTGSGTTQEVSVSINIPNAISYSHTEGTGVGKCTTGSSKTGSFSGTAIATGETDGVSTQIGIFVS